MTSLPQPNQDPGFNINTATNTFYKALADRLKAGQMTLDQARAAQAEMRALQLNPAAANRQAATDIAQRHLQVGQYSPANVAAQQAAQQPQGGLTLAQPQGVGGMGQSVNPVTPPQRMPQPPVMSVMTPPPTRTYYDPEGPVMPPPPMPQPQELPVAPTMPERHSDYGIPLWMQLGPGPERDAAYAQFMKSQGGGMQPKGIGGMLQPDSGYGSQQPMISDMAYRGPYKKPQGLAGIMGRLLDKGIGNDPMQPGFIGKHFTGDAPPPGKKYIETPEGLVPVPINDMPMRPSTGPGLGGALGMTMQPQGLTLSGPGVGKQLTLSNAPMQATAAPAASAPQGMAMGGLLRKYYGGGMC